MHGEFQVNLTRVYEQVRGEAEDKSSSISAFGGLGQILTWDA